MKAWAVWLLLLVPLWAAPSIDTSILADVRQGRWFTLQPAASQPTFRVHLVGTDADIVSRIEIFKGERLWQTIPDVGMEEPPYRGADVVAAVDANFDGYRDLRVLSWWGVTGNKGYRWWLYNPRTQHFDFCAALDGLSNATPHPDTRRISTHSVGGMAGQIYDNGWLTWSGRDLVLQREESQVSVDQDHLLRTIRERHHGQLQTISTRTVKVDL